MILLQYNLTAGFAPSTTATNVTGGTVTNASLSALTNGGAGYATDPVSSANPPNATIDAAAAITNNSYFSFSIAPTSGNSLSLTSLTFNAAKGGATTPRGYDVRSSRDTFAVTLGTANLTAQRTTFQAITIDLTGSSFQGITTNTTFNIYIYTPDSGKSVDWDDLIVNGTVASSGTVEQEGFRFRNDDGSETTATWLAVQDVNVIQPKTTNTRLRVILNSTLDRGSESYRLEFREVGGTTWTAIA